MTIWDKLIFGVVFFGVYYLVLRISGKRTKLNQHTNKDDYDPYNEGVDDNKSYLDDNY